MRIVQHLKGYAELQTYMDGIRNMMCRHTQEQQTYLTFDLPFDWSLDRDKHRGSTFKIASASLISIVTEDMSNDWLELETRQY